VTTNCPKCHHENPDDTLYCGKCGTQLPPPKDDRPQVTETLQTPIKELTTGSTFAGRYQVIEELGHGGMGRVYKVFDSDIKEKIALKLLRPEVALDRETVERFSNELKLARKISHRNVCRMFDLGKAEGTTFIAMEFVAGEDLKKLIRKTGQLGVGRAVSIGKQVCEGLMEAHHLGVVHRDLKPQNIMVDEDGNARIMDFGIARSLSGKGITGAGVMIGTPEYMSPEQVEGKEADQRSDIYSLAIILYEMLTGRVPFEGDTPFTVGVKHKSEIPRDPRELNTQIPQDVSWLVLKCLEKDKVKRYQSAEELHADLQRVEQGLPTTERVLAARKPFTSKEITVKFSLEKLVFPGLVIAALVIAAGLILWRVLPKKEAVSAESGPPSVAVLPFVDDSPEKVHDYLCEGIPSTLINALITIQNLRVPARTSAFSFAGKGLDIQAIGQKLNVENVLEGSIQVVGNNLRVTATLIKVKDGYQLWNATYDRKLEDVFAIQDEIAQAIVKVLKVRLLGEQEEPLVRRYTENIEAYKLYLEGLYYWNKRTGKDLNEAIELFNQALSKDPNYALAYVGLADSYSLLSLFGDARPQDVFPRAKAAATKALEINETLAEAHNSVAYVYESYDWNWKAAETEFKRALELNPNYAIGHFWYGELLLYFGRFEEAIREMKRALELDPVSLVINANLGWAYIMARQTDQALAQLHKTLEMDPNFAAARLFLGFANLEKRNFSEAINEMKKARELSGDTSVMVASLGKAYAAAGKFEEAKGILEELKVRSQKQHVSAYRMASVYAVMGDYDRAFELANKAYEERDENLIQIKVDHAFAPVHSDPRYKALLKKMGLD
jgi:TolB-like protein/Tfp pilus assembly protein PilF/tRNA A-37 threonylcarbamoyl transferase component Bud32